MSNMVYHKQVVKRHNTLASKERYQRKRERRKDIVKEEPKVRISWLQRMKLKMQMNPKDYRDYLALQEKKSHKITSIPELVPEIKKELIKPITKLNWFEKLVMFIRNIFTNKIKGA